MWGKIKWHTQKYIITFLVAILCKKIKWHYTKQLKAAKYFGELKQI